VWQCTAIAVAAGCFFCHLRCRPLTAQTLLLILFFIIGGLHSIPYLKPPSSPKNIYNQITKRQTATITGRLLRMPSVIRASDSIKSRLLLDVTSLRRPAGEESHYSSAAVDSYGRVQLTLNGPPPVDLQPGDILMARAVMTPVPSSSVPGSFNYKDFLSRQAIWITGWVRSPAWITKIHELPGQGWAQDYNRLRYLPEKIRGRLAEFLDRTLPQQTGSLYKAILIGDKSDVPPAILEQFKTTGCMHLLAISGMHMGLLAFLLIAGISWLLKRSTWLILHIPVLKTAALISLLPLAGYALIAGFNTPVIRALIMTTILSMAVIIDRKKSLINSVAVAAFLLLVWNPVSLFTVSFQLSFAAVLTIAVLYPRIVAIFPSRAGQSVKQTQRSRPLFLKISKGIQAGMIVSIAALAGTAPLLIYYFNRISLISPITNLFIEPFLCVWSLTLGLLACILLPLFPLLASSVLNVGSWGITASIWLVSLFSKLPFASLWLSTPTVVEIFCYYTLLACLLHQNPFRKEKIAIWQKTLLLASLGGLVIIPVSEKIQRKWTTETRMTVLDVGQGISIHIGLPGGKNLLLDGGGPSSDRFNVGEDLIAPYLWQQRISRIDDILISHPHADHYNGLSFIIQRFRPKNLWINGWAKSDGGIDSAYKKLLDIARQHDVNLQTCEPDTIISAGGAAVIQCLAPPVGPGTEPRSPDRNDTVITGNNINRHSMVVKLTHDISASEKNIAFLFPGDITMQEERQLLAKQRQALAADVLLAPHHGSRTSGSMEFLQAVSPSYIVISGGKADNKQYEESNLGEFCRLEGSTLLTTARDGTLAFTVTDHGLRLISF
jgi:competence protein ComEC